MELQQLVASVILQEESETLEYKAVLPPSKSIAQILSAFANTNGGVLILGVSEIGGLKISGLSEDFHATSITHKAIDLLTPKPVVDYGYVEHHNKKLFAINIQKSEIPILLEGKTFIRKGVEIVQANGAANFIKPGVYARISNIHSSLETLRNSSTDAKMKLIEHYQSVLKMVDNLSLLLYPVGPDKASNIKEGKILTRILFSSLVDTFETYLSDLLFEIYLAKPDTLRSEQMVKVDDVLNCSDIQEFITFWAKQKIGKLQKGSVKGFIAENKQIQVLKVIDGTMENEIEKILQIRHLYAHRNGMIDDKFLKYFTSGYLSGTEHQMPIDEILDKTQYLGNIIDQLDKAAITKYNLSTI